MRQSIRHGTFTSARVLIKISKDCIIHWNTKIKPSSWTAMAGKIFARSRLSKSNAVKLVKR